MASFPYQRPHYAVWGWVNDNNDFKEYSKGQMIELEISYQKYKRDNSTIGEIELGSGYTYDINYATMKQVNKKSGTSRSIRREVKDTELDYYRCVAACVLSGHEIDFCDACALGDIAQVRNLLSNHRIDVNFSVKYKNHIPIAPANYHALGIAVVNRHVDIVEILINHPDINPNRPFNEKDNDNSILNKNFQDLFKLDVNCSITPLGLACRNSDAEIVDLLLSHPNININDSFYTKLSMKNSLSTNSTALIEATKNAINSNDITIINKLLAHPNIDVNQKILDEISVSSKKLLHYKWTPLGLVCSSKNHCIDLAKALLKHRSIDVNREFTIVTVNENRSTTPLKASVFSNNVDLSLLLLEKGASFSDIHDIVHLIDPSRIDIIKTRYRSLLKNGSNPLPQVPAIPQPKPQRPNNTQPKPPPKDLRDFLQSINLESYYPKLIKFQVTDLQTLMQLEKSDFEEIIPNKPGHQLKLFKSVQQLQLNYYNAPGPSNYKPGNFSQPNNNINQGSSGQYHNQFPVGLSNQQAPPIPPR